MSDEIKDFRSVIDSTFDSIVKKDFDNANSIYNIWKKVLLTIKNEVNENEGRNLADHTRVVDLKNGMLFVEADHPGWIELLKIYKKYILVGLNRNLKEIKIESIAFMLAEKKNPLYGMNEKQVQQAKDEMIDKIEKEQKLLDERKFENSQKNVEIPAELKAVLDNLKADMLTNSKNK